MEKKVGFLQEETGVFSINRLIFLIGSIWVMLIVTYFAVKNNGSDIPGTIALFAGMQGPLIGMKIGQKIIETKNAKV